MARPGRHRLTAAPPSTGRVLLALAAIVGVLAVTAGTVAAVGLRRGSLTAVAAGFPLASQRIDVGDVAVAIRRVPDAAPALDSSAQEHLVAAVIADLETFWATTLPRIAGADFTPLRGGLTAVDSTAPDGSAPCVARLRQLVGNAFYCPVNDGIVYDSAALVPVLLQRYGTPGLVGAFAHEFGHAIQARVGPTPQSRTADPDRYPSLLIEAQGDCDAGAFLAWVAAGNAAHIHFGGASMTAAVGPLVDFADPVTVKPGGPTAHGLSLDRLTSVLTGYRNGAGACRDMALASLHPTLGRVPLPPGGAAALDVPRYPDTGAVLAAADGSIARMAGSAGVAPDGAPALPDGAPAAPDAARLAAVAAYGQFAQATVAALTSGRQWAQAQPPAEHPTAAPPSSRNDTGRAVAAACFAGAWVASVFGHAPAGALGSWPGDADEGLAALRAQPGATFAQAAGYADGFRGGLNACG